MDTCLGLWAIALVSQQQPHLKNIYELISANKARVFPKEYFDDLPCLLEQHIGDARADANASAAQAHKLARRLSAKPAVATAAAAQQGGPIDADADADDDSRALLRRRVRWLLLSTRLLPAERRAAKLIFRVVESWGEGRARVRASATEECCQCNRGCA